MRKVVLCTAFLYLAASGFSQPTPPPQPLTKQDYLQKSKSRKVAGFILLGVGATLIGIAAPGNVSFDLLPVLAIGGGGAVLGSIPLFIASGRNKRKAASITSYFSLQQNPLAAHTALPRPPLPAAVLMVHSPR